MPVLLFWETTISFLKNVFLDGPNTLEMGAWEFRNRECSKQVCGKCTTAECLEPFFRLAAGQHFGHVDLLSRHSVLCPGMTHHVADKAVWTAADRLVYSPLNKIWLPGTCFF